MKRNWKRGITCFLVVALVAVLGLGCGEEAKEEKVTIVIGEVTDLTGATSISLRPVHYVFKDVVDYFNDEDLIPGVELEVVTFDTSYKPAKDIPGYDWCRERGADLIMAALPITAEVLKSFAERDRVAVVSVSSTEPIIEPPGWVFTFSAPMGPEVKTLLKWISENHWDYQAEDRVPTVGFVGWRVPAGLVVDQAFTEYIEAHPDEFEYGGSALAPSVAMQFIGEAEQLKDCDYIIFLQLTGAWFIRDYRAKGFDRAMFAGVGGTASLQGFIVDMVDWEGVDGLLTLEVCRQLGEPYRMVELAEELLDRYRPNEAEDLIDTGNGYTSGVANVYAIFLILQKAIEEVGAENFDGQAYYDAAVDFEVEYEGYPRWYFTDTDRSLVHHLAVYEWSAAAEDLVRRSDWLSLVPVPD